MGKMEIPKQLLMDLDRLGLAECVEVFAVIKTGSLRQNPSQK